MTETLPTDGDRCPTCGQRVERGWYGDDLTNGYFPVAERAARCNLAVIERLREREAALREALEVYADPHFWQIQSVVPLGSFKALRVIPAARDGGAKAREALAADPAAPTTTEGRL